MNDAIKVTCGQCRYYEPALVGENGDCTQWDNQIKRGVSVQQNALFYREQLGGDSLYSNCEFLADEIRDCKRFAGRDVGLIMKIETNKQRTDRLDKEALATEKAAKKELNGVAVLYNEKPKDDGVTDHTPLYRHRSN